MASLKKKEKKRKKKVSNADKKITDRVQFHETSAARPLLGRWRALSRVFRSFFPLYPSSIGRNTRPRMRCEERIMSKVEPWRFVNAAVFALRISLDRIMFLGKTLIYADVRTR